MTRSLLLAVLFLPLCALAQTTTFDADFNADPVGQPPPTGGSAGDHPTGLFGQSADFLVREFFGAVGGSSAGGRVLTVEVDQPGGYRLVDFDGQSFSGTVTSGVVRVGFDFLAEAGSEGFAFLRDYDNAPGLPESFADIGFAFDDDSYGVGPLDYDPVTGDFLGWPRTGGFQYGVWYHLEAVIDLDANTLRVLVDGTDSGLEGGISRATGDGYRGSYINWGSAYAGRCAIDNFRVRVPDAGGLPDAPAGFISLLNNVANDCGGQILRLPDGDFRTPGVDWETSAAAQLVYEPVYDGVSTYKLAFNSDMDEADARLFATGRIPLQHNHVYEVSALIRTDFPRATWEVSVGINGTTPSGDGALGLRYGGMPAKTQGPDGWERWTWRFVPHWDARYPEGEFALTFHEYGPGYDDDVTFEIADFAVVACPAEPLVAFAPGAGVTFPGGAGNLPMAVESAQDTGDELVVTSTAAVYTFDRAAGTLLVEQRLDHPRPLTRLDNLPLGGLSVQSQTADVAVLVGNDLTVGVQCDGNVVISPHTAIQPELESLIGGDFNRLEAGDLVCRDDFGGFTASVHTPRGSGRRPAVQPLTANLPFVGLPGDDLTTFAAAAPGWRTRLPVQPGERLFVSAAPSRPYDWAKSFDFEWAIGDYNNDLDYYATPEYVTDWILWNFNQRGWAMSQGTDYVLRDDINAQAHFNAVAAQGDRWAAYFSQWFYYSRDPAEWVGAVSDWADAYGMEAMYSDGLAQDDWLSAYVAMRMLRNDVFPDGDIIIHDSYPQSGVPTASYKPAIYSYATSTYMGENAVVPVGEDWAWARYGMSMFRGSNAFGVIKGDGWTLGDSVDKYLVGLVWGGRGRPDVADYDSRYRSVLLQLKALWETYGDDPYFFDRYYHPDAQILTGYEIGRAGMPIFDVDTLANGDVTLAVTNRTPGSTIYYTLDGSEPTQDDETYTGVIPVDGELNLRARAYRADLDESAVATITLESAALPVAWTDVQARWAANCAGVTVRWETAAERSVASFSVERLGPDRRWSTVGDAVAPGARYETTDAAPASAQPFYRVRQTDLDGTVHYSAVVQPQDRDCEVRAVLRVEPNPVVGELRLRSSTDRALPYRITDGTGRVVRTGTTTGYLTRTNVSSLPAGLYYLQTGSTALRFVVN